MSTSGGLTFTVTRNPDALSADRRTELMAQPVFGRVATDHMVIVRYTEERGWHDAQVKARGPIQLDPSAAVLHYAQEIFEGLKAFPTEDGGAAVFRPEANARRFQKSAERMGMPELPESIFLESVDRLVKIDRDWIPRIEGGSLYLRPFMIASEAFLGVKPASEYLYMVIAAPVGSYFSGGTVSVWVSETYTRAAPGGTGAAKCGGNYAASLLAQAEAKKNDCDQVVFLDAVHHRFVEEMGGMNIFFVFDDGSIRTPPLSGTILPGITRETLLTIARERGLDVREEPYAIEDWVADAQSGHLVECFACGTAAAVTPIGKIRMASGEYTIGSGSSSGQIASSLKQALLDVQRGKVEDRHGWVHKIF
ncbi:branched-chain amino acid aminotransferase [Acetobacter sp. AN02]|uniref:branched-chain amino acid aminotransferase n=1 Tax=Acetobacter sp. AN02 TaxID=2894186 RepID=UPI0024341CE4|nr:branched-chain amino acid aminotransferase [Acetobacter sp. AN02]MDG6093956.1 branched-chain amino acid aminotransferase [Acetobacter sp. AN02]